MTTKTIADRKAVAARTTLQAYRRLFATTDGQLVLKDLMKSSFFFQPSVGADVQETYFNEGMRAAVLRILNTSKMDENQIEKLAANITAENASMYID